ncbi:MAG: sensor histidine kinase, partial [Candidatus Accumulibacter sp.]|nr:sensor histidine kinase [Accumulibacter sp.]
MNAGFRPEPAQPQPGSPTQAQFEPLYVPPNPEPDENIRHSLFGEILDWMLAPLLLLWPMSIAITYLVAKSIANQPFDDALEDRVTVLGQQIRTVGGKTVGQLRTAGRDILRADDVDSVYYLLAGPDGEHLDGDRDLPRPRANRAGEPARSGTVEFRNDTIHGTPIRVAYAYVNLDPLHERTVSPTPPPPLALVQVAETLDKRA